MARTKLPARASTPPGMRQPPDPYTCKPKRGDCGYVRVTDIIRRITSITRFLRLDPLNLKPDDFISIVEGMSQGGGAKALQKVSSVGNDVGVTGLEGLMGFAARNPNLYELRLCSSNIKLRDSGRLTSIITSLNSSHLRNLILPRVPRPTPECFMQLFDNLSPPSLVELVLSPCLTPGTIAAVARYLGSPRSRTLRELSLDYFTSDHIDIDAIKQLVDVVQSRNFGLILLRIPQKLWTEDKGKEDTNAGGSEGKGERGQEGGCRKACETDWAGLSVEVQRLSGFLERNKARVVNTRVRRAAIRYLSAARILLNARPLPTPSSSDTTDGQPPLSTSHFRLLDLPAEIIDQIVAETSGDVGALSQAQWDRLQQEAEGEDGLREMMRAAKGAGTKFLDEWAHWAGLDRWDVEGGDEGGVEAGTGLRDGDGDEGGSEDRDPAGQDDEEDEGEDISEEETADTDGDED